MAPPLVIKPVDEGSSIDVYICHTKEDVAVARKALGDRYPQLLGIGLDEAAQDGLDAGDGILNAFAFDVTHASFLFLCQVVMVDEFGHRATAHLKAKGS